MNLANKEHLFNKPHRAEIVEHNANVIGNSKDFAKARDHHHLTKEPRQWVNRKQEENNRQGATLHNPP